MKTLVAVMAYGAFSVLGIGCSQEQLRTVFPDEPLLNKPNNDPAAVAAGSRQPGLAAATTTQPTAVPPQVVEVTFPASGRRGEINSEENPDNNFNDVEESGDAQRGVGGELDEMDQR